MGKTILVVTIWMFAIYLLLLTIGNGNTTEYSVACPNYDISFGSNIQAMLDYTCK